MYVFCDLKSARVPHVVCIFSCPTCDKIKCSTYTKNYERLQEEPIPDFYLEKYGVPLFPLPDSIVRKQKALSKKERETEKKVLELEKLNKKKIKDQKKAEKELLKTEKKKLREDKKTARMIKKEISKRGRKAKLPEENVVKPTTDIPGEKKKRGRPKKVTVEISNKFFI